MGDLSLDTPLQESLEAEFCPPLDSTLVALLVADHISGSKPTEETLRTLRDQLTQLAVGAAADQDDLAKDLHDLRLSSAAPSATEDSQDVDSVFSQTGMDGSSSSTSSSTPPQEIASTSHANSAVAFLQALFPRLPLNQLKAHLEASKFDMESAVEELLTDEYIKELEERGLEDEIRDEEKDEWTVVSKKPRTPSRTAAIPRKRRKTKGKTIAVNDVRQKRHVRSEPQGSYSASDPWSQVASLSSYLETLLGQPSSFFQSYFHKPDHPTPAAALRASLRAIEGQAKEKYVEEPQTATLATFMEFVRASPEFDFDALDTEVQGRICTDAELVLSATSGAAADVSLDVLKLLHELEVDGESVQEMGVYHSPVSALHASASSSKSGISQSTLSVRVLPYPVGSVPVSPDSRAGPRATSTASKRLSLPVAPTQNAWQTVPTRRKPPEVHPLAAHIPAYDPHNVPRRKTRPVHPSVTKPSSTSSTSASTGHGRSKLVLGGYKARIAECHERRDEALRTASRHWNNGAGRNRGGEVALFYAQEAQRHREEAQRLQLDALKELVDKKRFSNPSTDTDTIDVHYCTTAEALAIVREVLSEGWCTPSRPLRIITGRGTHSSGGVAVLGPAVTKALEQDRWVVGRWDGGGGVSVRGRRK